MIQRVQEFKRVRRSPRQPSFSSSYPLSHCKPNVNEWSKRKYSLMLLTASLLRHSLVEPSDFSYTDDRALPPAFNTL